MFKRISILFVLLLALFLRTYHLNTLPPSLFSDEVDAGYQALVFNQNHTDYYGNKYPIHFHSFADYRTSLYIYSISFFNSIINNPELAVRLPSAIFSLVSVYLFYLLTGSVLAAFLLAINPWSIHYGRTGFEVSGMLMVILAGLYFLKKFFRRQQWIYLFLTVFFFCLSPYFYSTAKLFLLLIGLAILLIWYKNIFKMGFIKIFITLIFCGLLLLPMTIDTLHGRAGFRFSYIGIFTEPHREQITDNLRYQDARTDHPGEIGVATSFTSQIFHNKYQLVAQRFINNYVSTFSSQFLFLNGDNNLRHGFGGFGLLYLIDGVFIILGLFSIKDKFSLFFLLWLFLSPIPASLTRDSLGPHATRLILMLPSLIYFAFLGIKRLKSPSLKTAIIFLYCFFLITFCHYYYYHYPQDSALVWHTGMKEAVLATKNITHQNIIFSDSTEPFLPFFLFYYPYYLSANNSLANHLSSLSNDSFSGQVLDNQYYFGHLNWSNLDKLPPHTLIVVPKSEYESMKLSFSITKKISKTYINQEEFYIIQFP